MMGRMPSPPPESAAPLGGSCAPALGESRVPLVALLGRLEAAFVAEFDARLRDSDFDGLSLAHSRNVLRHLGAGPRRASQIVAVSDVSKQAISQQIAHLERRGYLRTEPDPNDSRARTLQLTDKGRDAQAYVKDSFVRIEQDWARLLPADTDLAALRAALAALVGALQQAAAACRDNDCEGAS
jgi:DNA-binding MarR family transcriptional regulator